MREKNLEKYFSRYIYVVQMVYIVLIQLLTIGHNNNNSFSYPFVCKNKDYIQV